MFRQGSSGTEVEALQRALASKGIDPGPVDGIFGPKTEAAVRQFQQINGLQADGIAGAHTMLALEDDSEPPRPDDASIV
jgi:peptidoglycan hydrolase-like protein with peptidoglycan-binding domain